MSNSRSRLWQFWIYTLEIVDLHISYQYADPDLPVILDSHIGNSGFLICGSRLAKVKIWKCLCANRELLMCESRITDMQIQNYLCMNP